MNHQLSTGLPDEEFLSDGLLTKRVLRAAALSGLAPSGGDLLWDLGAGSGSIGIEWCRLDPGNRAVAVERHPERLERIAVNAERHRVGARLRIVAGSIADALPGLPAPDAVFVGGGVEAGVLAASWAALAPGGRLVAHSVTADSDAVLLDAHRSHGGELLRIGLEYAEPIGRFTGFRPARTVTAWTATKT